MSRTPPARNRWVVACAIVAVLAIVTVVWLVPSGSPLPPDPVVVPPTLSPARRPTEPSTVSQRSQAIPTALARTVAAVGAYDDGRRSDLEGLPDVQRALVDAARVLLAGTPRRKAPGLPMVLPDGTVAGVAPDPVPRDDTVNPPVPSLPGDPTLSEREHARAVDGRLIARTLSSTGKAPAPTRGDRVKEILEPDAWIAVPYNPALVAGEPLEITNRSLGQYVLRLDADDYGSVRLNGGLVVPGRFYLMDGTMRISGDVPVGVTIRPLRVVHGYFDQPVRPPSANG